MAQKPIDCTALLQLIQQDEGQLLEFKLESEKQSGTLDYEQTALPNALLEDLNERKVKEFLTKRLRTSLPDYSLEKLLLDMGAATQTAEQQTRPTLAGMLFFGTWPQFHLSHATILAARFVGARGIKIIDRDTIEGALPEMIEHAIQFVQRNTRHGLQIGHPHTAKAQEVDEYPLDAVREAITNACCHRDYQEKLPIQLKIYEDRIVITNPGGLLPGLDLNALEGKHKTRNPILANWLQTMGFVERFGVGIARMNEAMRQANLPAPLLQSQPDRFEVTLIGPAQSFMAETKQVDTSATTGQPSQDHTFGNLFNHLPWYARPFRTAN